MKHAKLRNLSTIIIGTAILAAALVHNNAIARTAWSTASVQQSSASMQIGSLVKLVTSVLAHIVERAWVPHIPPWFSLGFHFLPGGLSISPWTWHPQIRYKLGCCCDPSTVPAPDTYKCRVGAKHNGSCLWESGWAFKSRQSIAVKKMFYALNPRQCRFNHG